jgi:hypothetical protein
MNFFKLTRQGAIAMIILINLVLTFSVKGQKLDSLNGRPVLHLSNDKIDLILRAVGGSFVNLTLKDDPTKLSPYSTGLGHFIALDGFGPPSRDESKAGLKNHGEANLQPLVVTTNKTDKTQTLSWSALLPITQENYKRTLHMVDGEQVVYVETEVESLLGFDRPVFWGEHMTLGPPFLELGKTTVDMSSKIGKSRDTKSQGKPNDRLGDFTLIKWPMGLGKNGTKWKKSNLVNLRVTPATAPSFDQMTLLMDTTKKYAFVTAFHPDKRMLLGYIFKHQEYPWLQIWDSYGGPPRNSMSRGLEFASQPFDMPRREVVDLPSVLGGPRYRWLPAKSKVGSSFLLFWVHMPDGMTKVDDVTLENGVITVIDKAAGKTITLNASRGL